MDAMHGLCIECHKERALELGRPHHGDCATCHQDGRETPVEDRDRRWWRDALRVGSRG
jgi:hypothetical protein